MELINLGLVRPQVIILDVVPLIGRNVDLTPKKQLVITDLQGLLHVLGLLEAHDRVPLRTLADHFDPRHFAVLLVLVKKPVF